MRSLCTETFGQLLVLRFQQKTIQKFSFCQNFLIWVHGTQIVSLFFIYMENSLSRSIEHPTFFNLTIVEWSLSFRNTQNFSSPKFSKLLEIKLIIIKVTSLYYTVSFCWQSVDVSTEIEIMFIQLDWVKIKSTRLRITDLWGKKFFLCAISLKDRKIFSQHFPTN